MPARETYRPVLTGDARRNQRLLDDLLRSSPGGTIELPVGDFALSDGLTVPAGWRLHGAASATGGPATWLSSGSTTGRPVLRVSGSDVTITGVGLRPPASAPGEHAGDLGTAITVGQYLYDAEPEWIENVELRSISVRRPGDRAANCVALMGAVRGVVVSDITVVGGFTGLAVHWGAVGATVGSITGPSYHPHLLRISNLRVSDAVEGFYLSSVHDVTVAGACLSDVEMGFRLLPGDNTDRFHRDPNATIGQRIEVRDVCVRWSGDRYAVRVAGWGRSEVDGAISVLRYRDVVVRDCTLTRVPRATPQPPRSWAPVLVESADGVTLDDIRVAAAPEDPRRPCCGTGAARNGVDQPGSS